MNEKGTLYLCATPIGNLEDITLRALRILREVDLIAAEDTRQTIKLLNHFEINKPLTSYYEHNKVEKGKYIVEQLLQGKDIALVSDAGTPGISDPGEDLVKLCIQNGITVSALPGPVAAITGLILSGLSTGRFCFEGFLAVNKRNRREHLEAIKNDTRTLIFYEAPHKLTNTLKDMLQILGNRNIAIARELTKKFEEVIRCTIEEAIQKFEQNMPKGEFVLIIEGANKQQVEEEKQREWAEISIYDHINMYISQGIDRKEALKKVAKDRGLSKREVYALQLENKEA
ncbi:MAG: rRNA (cytidine1402-2-O)-methyltransferase [Petroclostridium sp.]|jgi:16S rRNA (cytidine1402-2'-O)-methyltransferase|uniref:16S rRNA (cytidine(1402)-2'-O)-methyltransferase n=1 Tax=Petroclostridium xylanilyticum TaxID=1792311 RepID=UPI000B98C330|nr:16S rRNA (cytidine(1402)-2'-O)-methyltransferase [Petroclostridium xylanilyticum]MBZ4646108.1 Uroporphyrin-III C/tetrapyrrole (Corrin/Porphyrin) methyltransferase [Clostridia bacterium]MDK2810928.1 rRNA (cytidine1402-2-O)-methyltransferase [Petroclostridium sp.]